VLGRKTARLSPVHWRNRNRCAELTVAAEQLELAVRDTRLLGRAAIRVLERDPDLPAAHVVGQVRSIAAALLRAMGLDRAEAVDRVRRAVSD
jgi:hypothetical protein